MLFLCMHPDDAAGIRLFRSKICPSDQGCMPVWAMMHSGRLLPQVSTDFVKLHAIPGVFAKFDIYDDKIAFLRSVHGIYNSHAVNQSVVVHRQLYSAEFEYVMNQLSLLFTTIMSLP